MTLQFRGKGGGLIRVKGKIGPQSPFNVEEMQIYLWECRKSRKGHVSQTGPKKCFIPKIVKNTPILIQQSTACNVYNYQPWSYVSLKKKKKGKVETEAQGSRP